MPESSSETPCWRCRAFCLAVIVVFVVIGGIYWYTRPTQTPSAVAEKIGASVSVTKAIAVQTTNAVVNDPRAASITFDGATRLVVPNARGEFPRTIVPASSEIAASVPFAGAQPGEKIAVQAEDGGLLLGESAQGQIALDAQCRAPVRFKVSAYDGMHRVTLRRGGESRVLEFWVGAEPPVVVRK